LGKKNQKQRGRGGVEKKGGGKRGGEKQWCIERDSCGVRKRGKKEREGKVEQGQIGKAD